MNNDIGFALMLPSWLPEWGEKVRGWLGPGEGAREEDLSGFNFSSRVKFKIKVKI